jgi:hypothetical protein
MCVAGKEDVYASLVPLMPGSVVRYGMYFARGQEVRDEEGLSLKSACGICCGCWSSMRTRGIEGKACEGEKPVYSMPGREQTKRAKEGKVGKSIFR